MKKVIVKYNYYQDSIILVGIAAKIQQVEGVVQAVVLMAYQANKELLAELGMSDPEIEKATPNDLLIGLEAESEQVIDRLVNNLDSFLAPSLKSDEVFPNIDLAIQSAPDANLAVISVPGEFAGQEALKAINKGLNVFIFSDNVPLEEEIELKRLGKDKGLLVMGPGCGTAVINHVSLGLMSVISPGPVGIVGASGSGIQEIAVLLDKSGTGISQAIGTGGRDLSEEVGGVSMIQGIETLEHDEETKVIVLVSKRPAEATMEKILSLISACTKPVIVNFIASDSTPVQQSGAIPASTLEEAALKAAGLLKGEILTDAYRVELRDKITSQAKKERKKFSNSQKFLRGVFCGGTHCQEAEYIIREYIGEIYSNTHLNSSKPLDDPFTSFKHSLIDLGEEEFTVGKPHPVIDPATVKQRMLQEAKDPEVAIILMDIILGLGAHADPVGLLAGSIKSLKEEARSQGRHLCIVASVCGTNKDPQKLEEQENKLADAGVLLFPSNAQACLFAGLACP